MLSSMQPPKGFIVSQDAGSKIGQSINIIGVVTDYLPPAPSKGADWQCSLNIIDSLEFLSAKVGLRIKFFRPRELLPEVESLGSIALCRNIKITIFQGMLSAVSTRATECIIFPRATIPTPSYDLAYQGRKQELPHTAFPAYAKPTVGEQVFAIHLYDSCGKHVNSSVVISSRENNPSRRPNTSEPTSQSYQNSFSAGKRTAKFSMIKDVADSRFSDLVVEIIKIYPCTDGSVEIYVTDYTHNGLLFHYINPEEESKDYGTESMYEYSGIQKKNRWPGPFGKMTLQIKVWPPHSSWLHENVKEENYVFLRNVRIKTSLDARLEGSLHADKQYSNRIDVQLLKLNDPEVIQLLRRKQDYWKKLRASKAGNKFEHMTKAERKRKMRRDKKERNRIGDAENLDTRLLNPTSNQHVKCANPHIPFNTIEQINNATCRSFKPPNESNIFLPFVNMKFRLQVRVVDYWPEQIKDFSRSITDVIYNPFSGAVSETSECDVESNSSTSTQISPYSTARNWEWAFYLLVEDVAAKGALYSTEPSKMPLLVAHDDAVHLLKLDATDLRKDSNSLAQLREKLFILWGNLEDVKAGREMKLSSRPFETCVREYGLRDSNGWRIMRSMFGTTII